MASIDIDKVWIQDPYDWTQRVVCGSNGRDEKDVVDAQVRTYANDRRRNIASARTAHNISVTLTWLTEGEKEWIRQRKGTIILYRDRKGTKIYAMYPGVQISTYKDNIHYDVKISLQSVTFLEAV